MVFTFSFSETSVTLQQNHEMAKTLTFISFSPSLLKAQHYQSSTWRYLVTALIISYIRTTASCTTSYLSHSHFQQLWLLSTIPTESLNVVGKSYRTNCISCFHTIVSQVTKTAEYTGITTVFYSFFYLAIKRHKNYFAFKDFQTYVDTPHNNA